MLETNQRDSSISTNWKLKSTGTIYIRISKMDISGVIQEKKNHILKLKPDPEIQEEQNKIEQSSVHNG